MRILSQDRRTQVWAAVFTVSIIALGVQGLVPESPKALPAFTIEAKPERLTLVAGHNEIVLTVGERCELRRTTER
jgi:hypothetical protein